MDYCKNVLTHLFFREKRMIGLPSVRFFFPPAVTSHVLDRFKRSADIDCERVFTAKPYTYRTINRFRLQYTAFTTFALLAWMEF